MRLSLLLIVLVLLAARVSAVSFESNFDFHASIAGTNVLHPGDKTSVTLLLSCEVTGGSIEYLPVNENTSEILPMLTTAKDVRLEPYASVVEVESEEILVGDLPCGRTIPITIVVDVDEDAMEGSHNLRFDVEYTKMRAEIDAGGNVTLKYVTNQKDSISAEIKIEKKDYDFSVQSVTSDLVAGREGVVTVKIKNTGQKTIYNAVLILNTTPPLKPNPKAMSVYVGDMESGDTATASFKVFVPGGVFLQSYPAELVMIFRTSSGMPAKNSKPLGLKISGKGYFEVEKVSEFLSSAKTVRVEQKVQMPSLSIPAIPQMQQESKTQQVSNIVSIPSRGYLTIRITNTGDPIKDAYASLIFDNPLLVSTSTPYIGDMESGESSNLTFYITSNAPAGSYLGYVIIKYKDDYGDEVVSPKIYVNVDVSANPALSVNAVETSNVGVGLVGDVELSLSGEMDVSNVKLYLLSPDSTITPVSSTAYIDSINEKARFRISVSDDSLAGKHLLYLIESFDTPYAKDLVSVAEFPIYITPKLAAFQVVSIKSDLYPDSTGEVVLEIKNSGNAEIYNTVVMLEVSPPLSIAGTSSISSFIGQSQPGEYFIGTMKPGDVAKAKFRVEVDKDAGEGSYPASVKVKYHDENGYSHTSNSIVVSLEVKQSQPYLIYIALFLALIALIAAGGFVRKRMKEKR
ncbi:COG1361 S-layer family protein [Archaeoglobus sp.]